MDEKTIYYDLGKSYRNTYIETDNEVDCSDAEETDLLISLGIENDDASLDIANSPLINAGVININHKNQIESQDILGIYPIKVDSTGHITEIGDSFSLNNVSNENDGLMFAVKEDNIQDSEISNNDLLFDATTLKYAKLPSTAFTDTNTTYEDGETGYVLKAKQDSEGNQINTTYAPLLNPEFIGNVKVPTAETGDNSTLAANTLFVNNAISSLAPLNSPSLTGVPTAPTASKGTNTAQLATTEYVQTAILDYAPLSNANLIGIPTAPKAVKGTNTTQIATTSFVAEAISGLEYTLPSDVVQDNNYVHTDNNFSNEKNQILNDLGNGDFKYYKYYDENYDFDMTCLYSGNYDYNTLIDDKTFGEYLYDLLSSTLFELTLNPDFAETINSNSILKELFSILLNQLTENSCCIVIARILSLISFYPNQNKVILYLTDGRGIEYIEENGQQTLSYILDGAYRAGTNISIANDGTINNTYTLPSDVVQDSDYVHTDNNYTTEEKTKLASLEEVSNVDIGVSKSGNTATVTITKKDGTEKSEDIEDGVGLDYNWQGTSLGIKKETEQQYQYVDLVGDCNFATFEINSSMELVMNKTSDMLLQFEINEMGELEVII